MKYLCYANNNLLRANKMWTLVIDFLTSIRWLFAATYNCLISMGDTLDTNYNCYDIDRPIWKPWNHPLFLSIYTQTNCNLPEVENEALNVSF